MGSKRKILRVLLFDPNATDSDSDSDFESQKKNSQIKNNKRVIQTIELHKSTPIGKPKSTLPRSLSPPRDSKTLMQTTNRPQNPKKPQAPKDDSSLGRKQPSSQYKGVRRRQSGNWAAEIRDPIRGTRIWLGTFKSEQMAHEVYQSAFLHFEQEKAKLQETQTTGPVQCCQSAEEIPPSSFVTKPKLEVEVNTGDVQCSDTVLALPSPLYKKKMKKAKPECIEIIEDRVNTGPVQCVKSDEPQHVASIKKQRTKTIIGPPIHFSEIDDENRVKSGSSITSISTSTSREISLSSILDSGLPEKEKGDAEELFPGLEIPDFNFQFDEAEGMTLLEELGSEEDLIRLDDVPLWTENLDSCDLSFLDM